MGYDVAEANTTGEEVQAESRVNVDGVVGPKTLMAFEEKIYPESVGEPYGAYSGNDSGDDKLDDLLKGGDEVISPVIRTDLYKVQFHGVTYEGAVEVTLDPKAGVKVSTDGSISYKTDKMELKGTIEGITEQLKYRIKMRLLLMKLR